MSDTSVTNRFLELFYQLSQIPRESGKEKRFADFLEEFAKKNNLECYRDKNNNVLIKKSGNKKNNEPIILQAHMDMVCVKKENSNHDFDTDPIEIVRNGDMISAKDTSLGADQGIGLAIMLFILESRKIKHPDLECLFTTEEETTFHGAENFDYSKLKGKRLINIDHAKDDSIVIGCDADICNQYVFEGNYITTNMPSYKITISGVEGGNSGWEIERSSKNAIFIMAKIIQKLQAEKDVYICQISGGNSENDIATSCECIIKTDIKDIENKIKSYIEENSDIIEGFTRAVYRGQQWVKEHSAREIAEVIQDFFPDTTVESLEQSVQSYKDIDAWNENPILKEESFDKLQLIMTEAGELDQKAPYDKIVNDSYAEKVINE